MRRYPVCRTPLEDTRLRTPPREVVGAEALHYVEPKASYAIAERSLKYITHCDGRRAQVLLDRKLIAGRIDRKDELIGFVLAPNVRPSQVKNVMRLKPPSISICNRATVVKVMPTTYTHRSSLMAGY